MFSLWNWLKSLFRPKHHAGMRDWRWPTREQINALPPYNGLRLDDILVVSTPQAAQRAREELLREAVLGFDTESKPTFVKGQVSTGPHVAQFSSRRRGYVLPLHLQEGRDVVREVMCNETIMKVGFGLRDDLKKLPAKLNIELKNVYDVENLFAEKGYGRGVGVKVGVALVFKKRFLKSKKIGTSNWMNRHLSTAQILYAANDAYAAIQVYQALKDSSRRG